VTKPEWVGPYFAVSRLATEWGIPQTIAEGIVWNALQSAEVLVRGVPRGSIVPRIISKEIGASLLRGYLTVSDFSDVEIEWNSLLNYARNVIPTGIEVCELPPREPHRRPLNEKIAEKFAADYIAAKLQAGRHPTMLGLQTAAAEANFRGGRDYLREAFRKLRGPDEVRVGRPPKKFAKK
jgi:hypothetical protein